LLTSASLGTPIIFPFFVESVVNRRGKIKKSTATITPIAGPQEPLKNVKADDALSIAEYGAGAGVVQ
jgi:hypothetical protein